MKQYKTRPGVVLTKIGGQNILVAAKKLQEFCPYVSQINETAAFCWRILEQGADIDILAEKLAEEYQISDLASLRADLSELLAQMTAANYLIESS